MEEFSTVESMVDHVKDYMHVRVDEVRLGVAERSSGVVASLAAGAFLSGIFFLCFMFLSVGAALWLGRLLHDLTWGFLIVAAFQLVLGLIVWGLKRQLIQIPVMNAILDQLLLKKSHHEEN